MHIAYLVELVAVLAAGLGTARWALGSVVADDAPDPDLRWGPWLDRAGGGLITGVALAGLVGLAVEVARGRTPRPWGLGRWAWSVVGLFLAARLGFQSTTNALSNLFGRGSSWGDLFANLPDSLRVSIEVSPVHNLFYLIPALVLTRRMAVPGPVLADAREWAGRVFAASVAAISLAEIAAWRFEYSLFHS